MPEDLLAKQLAEEEHAWLMTYRKLKSCGPGSSMPATSDLRTALPGLLKKYGIKTFADAGCGDASWVHLVLPFDVVYHGYDVTPEALELAKKNVGDRVTLWNILKHPLPKHDLIMCRDVLIHFAMVDVQHALRLFKDSQSTYLLTTTFSKSKNIDRGRAAIYKPNGIGFTPWNLEAEPFNLKAVERIPETHPSCCGRDVILARL